jgi:threonine dehydrogenase-like Zn-dependent dehydrogenase
MKALVFSFKPLRFAYSKILGRFSTGAYYGRFSALSYKECPEPELPGDEWVRIRTAYCGICASDLHAIFLKGGLDNPTTPFVSFPMSLGHEIVGTIEQTGARVEGLSQGDRVVVNAMLSCVTRGIDPLCPHCQEGNVALCCNFAEGDLPPGLMIGSNKGLSGGFAPFVVAHERQCIRMPEGVGFDEAALADPFGVALRGILQNPPRAGETALVYSCGTLGLSAVMALRTLYPEVRVIAVAKHDFQKELAARFGAHEVLSPGASIFEEVAGVTGGRLYKPFRGKPILMGGVAVVYDCVGSADTIETGLRLADGKGKVVVIGAEPPKRFEWSPIWFREISLVGSMAGGAEVFRGKPMHSFEVYLELLAERAIDVRPLITHKFALSQYKEAIATCVNKRSARSVKVLFEFP